MQDASTPSASSGASLGLFARKTLIVLLVIVLTLFFWQISSVLLLAFAGLLLAVFLRGLAARLASHLPLSEGWSLGVVILAMVLLIGGFVWLTGPRLSREITQIAQELPATLQAVRDQLQQYPWGEQVIQQAGSTESILTRGMNIFGRVTGVASTLFGMLTNLLLFLAIGLYLAFNPRLYERGIVKLAPKRHRDRAQEVLETTGNALWLWLIGRIIAMVLVGVLTTIGLQLLGVPLALVLGVVAGLLDFVPFFGPIAAAVPGILFALTVGPTQALYVAIMYLVVQQIEGNVITPLVQEKVVSLPPVLTLLATVSFGLVFGVAGVMLATPLALVLLVWAKMLYVEDTLGDHVAVPGRKER